MPPKIRPRCLDVLAEGKFQHLSGLGDDGGIILELTAHLLELEHGFGSRLTYGASEPVLEACRAEAWVIAGSEALIVHLYAEVERLGIGDYRPCVLSCLQELPHEVVLPNRFGTG